MRFEKKIENTSRSIKQMRAQKEAKKHQQESVKAKNT